MAANIETKTSRIKALLLTMDGIMKTKSDPYELLRTGVLHSESVRREDKAVLVSDLLKEVLPKYRHCIVGSLRVPFSRALFRAKMDELRVAKERPIEDAHARASDCLFRHRRGFGAAGAARQQGPEGASD